MAPALRQHRRRRGDDRLKNAQLSADPQRPGPYLGRFGVSGEPRVQPAAPLIEAIVAGQYRRRSTPIPSPAGTWAGSAKQCSRATCRLARSTFSRVNRANPDSLNSYASASAVSLSGRIAVPSPQRRLSLGLDDSLPAALPHRLQQPAEPPPPCASRTRMDLSTSPATRSGTSSRTIPSPEQAPSAASRSRPPANTEARAHSSRSFSLDRPKLQSISARSVWCPPQLHRRSGGDQPEPVVQPVEQLLADNARNRTAANSIASGMPSSR